MNCLADMGLSVPQSAAVTDDRSQVLVAAGAGSGKTRVLIAAVVRALIDEALPVDRLVAVTFTRKAGAELAARVREALHACGRPDLASSLDSAMIGTIDALCLRLLRDNALEAGVDPSCVILEPEAATLAKDEVMRGVWEAAVQGADDDRLETLASHGASLGREVVVLYDRLRGLGNERPQIEVPPGLAEEEARSRLLSATEEALAIAETLSARSKTLDDDLSKLRSCLDWLEGSATYRHTDSGLRMSGSFYPSRKTKALEAAFAPVRVALREYRCALAEWWLRPLAEATNDLLADVHQRYSAYKEERGLIDFADLELKTRALLQGRRERGKPAGGVPGAFLLVDEFQDTNELQWAILSDLGAARVLTVGDERQSIYRFRGADVGVIRRRQTALASRSGGASDGTVHRLDVNYRSHPEIIAVMNRLFAHKDLFGEGFSPLEADPEWTSAHPGAVVAGPRPATRVEILVADRRREEEGTGRHVPMQLSEAEVLAERIRRLCDEEGWRQRDIVVLLPTQTYVDLYQSALAAHGVDVYLVRGRGYYGQEEVTDGTSLLRLLVNPHHDVALISVLRSPLVGISDDALYLLGKERRAKKALSLWEVVRSRGVDVLAGEDRAALREFLDRMAALRSKTGRPRLSHLIDEAISIFSYDVCALLAPGGRRRFANVRKLMRLADEFEASRGPDLAGFLGLIESMGRLSDREGSAPTLAEGEDVVRVMTVHQAKGLEFPVVVLAGLGAADAHRPEISTIVVGSDGRTGLFLKGYRKTSYESHELSWGPAADIVVAESRKDQEEDVRLLYVAMTRAEERLVLVGARPKNDSLKGNRIGKILSALGLERLPGNGESFPLEGISCQVVGVGPRPGQATSTREESLGPEPSEHKCPQPLEATPTVAIPGSVSFSALAAYEQCPRRFYLERVLGLTLTALGSGEAGEGNDSLGQGVLDDEERQAGRDVGILTHWLLQHLAGDGRRPHERTVLAASEQWLCDSGMSLSEEELKRATKLTLAAWDSPTAEVLSLPSALREAPFLFALKDTVVSGYMDVVIRGSDEWRVVDFKTNALRGRPVSDLAKCYALQADVYCLAALRAGARSVRMDFVFLESPNDAATVHRDSDDMPGLEKSVGEVVSGIEERSFPQKTGETCERCPVLNVCGSMAPG